MCLFHYQQRKIDHFGYHIKFKSFNLLPTANFKHFGSYIDGNVLYDYHRNELSKALSRSSGIVAKLRHFMPEKILITAN